MSDQKYENLVFEGGAVLGVAYLGVVEVLEKQELLADIERVAGASAGAITALVTSFNLKASEIAAIAAGLNYSRIPDPGKPTLAERVLLILFNKVLGVHLSFKDLNCLERLIKHNGWYSSDYFYTWLRDTIDSQFSDANKKDAYTFADFHNRPSKNERPFKDLSVVVTNMSTQSTEIFSYAKTPDVEVAKAVQMSMSIPLFFQSQNFEYPGYGVENTFSDGGTMWNFPLAIFDSATGPNKKTLGSRFKVDPIPPSTGTINNLQDYIESVVLALHAVQENYFRNTPDDAPRSISIDVSNIPNLKHGLNFNITPGGIIYEELKKRGREAANQFFNVPKES